MIGDEWSERIRSAARRLAPREPSSYGVVLLGDIKATFTDRFFSADLAEALAKIEGRPWAEWGRAGKPISANQIAKLLKEYKICPDQLRIGDRTAKGYHLHQFTEAFQRYLGPHPPTEPKQRNKPTATGTSELFRNETEKTDVSVQKCEKPASKGHCFDVSVQKGGAPVCEHHNGGARAFESDVEDAQEELRERGLTVCEQCGRAGRDVLPFAYAGHVGTLHPRCRHSWLLAHGVDLGIPAALRRSQ